MCYRLLIIFSMMLLIPTHAFAWNGWDYENGTAVEIDKGNLVRDGETIEFFDYDAGEYKTGTVQDVNRYGSSVDVEVQDDDTGETRTLNMDSE